MKAKELQDALAVTRAQLSDWIKEGLPFKIVRGVREFDPRKVRDWLLRRGIATAAETVPTLEQAARALAIQPKTLKTWIEQGAPDKTTDGYDVGALRSWRTTRREDDPFLSGPSSPALESYREARAAIARLDLLERQRELVPREILRRCLQQMIAFQQQAGQALESRFGPEALKMHNDLIRNLRRVVDSTFAPYEPAAGENDQAHFQEQS